VSVDVVGVLTRPVSLASVLDCAGAAMRALLGLDAAPGLIVIGGCRGQEDPRMPSGREPSAEGLAGMMIGDRIPAGPNGLAGSLAFEVGLVGANDRAYVMVIDLTEAGGAGACVEAVVSPTRTCVGVVLATAVALGAAIASGGEFVDIELMMLDEPVEDPARFIESARLSGGAGDLAERCEQFMRQFPQLGGWPRDRSAR
jgi:hypothetical protein